MRCRLASLWIMRMPRSISRVRPMVASCPHSGSAVYFATTSGSLQIQSFGVRASGMQDVACKMCIRDRLPDTGERYLSTAMFTE